MNRASGNRAGKPRVYFLAGPERGEKKRFMEAEVAAFLAERKVSAGSADIDSRRYYLFETPLQTVIEEIQNIPMFSSARIITCFNAEDIKQKDDLAMLQKLLENTPEDCLVFFETEKTNTKECKIAAFFPKDQLKIFYEMFDNQKRGWLLHWFREQGKNLQQEAADILLEMIENNTLELERESRSLLLHYAGEQTITAEMAERFLVHSRRESAFSLFAHMMQGDIEASLGCLQQILNEGETQPVALVAGLLWQARQLSDFHNLTAQRISQAEIFVKIRAFGQKAQRQVTENARRYNLKQCEQLLSNTLALDSMVRTTRAEMIPLVLESYVYDWVCKGSLFNALATQSHRLV